MMKQESEKFRIDLKSSLHLKNPYLFREYYTGGPVPLPREDGFVNYKNPNEIHVTPQELKHIILI